MSQVSQLTHTSARIPCLPHRICMQTGRHRLGTGRWDRLHTCFVQHSPDKILGSTPCSQNYHSKLCRCRLHSHRSSIGRFALDRCQRDRRHTYSGLAVPDRFPFDTLHTRSCHSQSSPEYMQRYAYLYICIYVYIYICIYMVEFFFDPTANMVCDKIAQNFSLSHTKHAYNVILHWNPPGDKRRRLGAS